MEVIFVNSTFSFADMGNYMAMDRASRNALDQMSKNVRNSADLISFSTNQLVLKYSGTTNLTYGGLHAEVKKAAAERWDILRHWLWRPAVQTALAYLNSRRML